MSSGFITFIIIVFLTALGSGAIVFLICRKLKIPASSACGVAASAFVVFVFPLPIHGGVEFLGPVLLRQLRQASQRQEDIRVHVVKNQVRTRLIERFKAAIEPPFPFNSTYDEKSGLVWLTPQSFSGNSLAEAQATCSSIEPRGKFTLAGEGEHYQFWRSFGYDARSKEAGRYLSFSMFEEGFTLPTTVITRESGTGAANSGVNTVVPSKIFCVARTSSAPQQGYPSFDIDPSAWNQFQLSRLNSRTPQDK